MWRWEVQKVSTPRHSLPPTPSHQGQEKARKFEASTPFSAAPSQGVLHFPRHSLLPLLRQVACASQPTPSYSFPPRSRKVPETSKPFAPSHRLWDFGTKNGRTRGQQESISENRGSKNCRTQVRTPAEVMKAPTACSCEQAHKPCAVLY